MAKKVTIIQQQTIDGRASERIESVIVDDFDLREDYYDYLTGIKKDPNGNAVMGAMIGNVKYVRFSEVIDIHVEEYDEETAK